MKLIKQKSNTTCGQSCVAMLLGLPVSHDNIMTDAEMENLFGKTFTKGVPPTNVLALQKHLEPRGLREHWSVSHYGTTLDPAGIPEEFRWPVYKYLIV